MKEIMKKLDEYFYTTSKDQLIDDDTNGDIILANWEIYKLYEEVKKLTETKLMAIEYICNTLCDSKAMVRKDILGKEIDNLIHILEGGESNERERN